MYLLYMARQFHQCIESCSLKTSPADGQSSMCDTVQLLFVERTLGAITVCSAI